MLIDVIESGAKEADIQAYLERHNYILKASIGQAFLAHNIVLPQFRLGSDGGIPDFIVVTGQSYSFEIHVVDLKLPTLKRFNNDDSISSELKNAITQVKLYKAWIEDNLEYFRDVLKDCIVNMEPDFDENFNLCRRFNITADLIAGRRSDLNKKRRCIARDLAVRLISYDRLLETENRLLEMMSKNIPFEYFDRDFIIAQKYDGFTMKNVVSKE